LHVIREGHRLSPMLRDSIHRGRLFACDW
jgi:hypothetical protein